MAALFTAASTQYLTNAAPAVLDYPFTVGMWVNLAALGTVTRGLWALSDTATTNNWFGVEIASTEVVRVAAAAGGSQNSAGLLTPLVVGTWNFVVARFIGSGNRRIAGLYATGSTEHAQGITARAPAGMDTMSIGARQDSSGPLVPMEGSIAEIWYTNTDIQADGAQLQEAMLFQLAYGGPFSVPHIAKDIIEYRSFRKYPSSEGDEIGEVFHGALDRQIWSNINGVTIGPHPPLPYWYRKPEDISRTLVI